MAVCEIPAGFFFTAARYGDACVGESLDVISRGAVGSGDASEQAKHSSPKESQSESCEGVRVRMRESVQKREIYRRRMSR